ncbi:carboxylate--amine ligase [Ornithinibacillus contaminans]|uniref:carboxylate--amine ligase n=1 Tax=Ornithinibacillus contaminans TaxID=694055 RepID=UPI00064D9E2D|nr:carboxylate--amine ligase [Ornithinibacillus contaminans]
MKHKAVILGNNYYIGLSTIRSLGIHGVHTVAVDYSEEDRYGAASKYCAESILVPHYKEETEGFIHALIDYAKKQDEKPVLIPCHDTYLEVLDAHLNTIKEYYLIPQTEQGLATKVMNKDHLYALAEEHGVRAPETVRIHEPNFKERVLEEIKFPCIVKPVDSPAFVSTFRKKIFMVHTMEELDEALEKAKAANLEVFVQRIIPGFDDHMYTFDAYLDQNSKVTHWTTCQKLRQYPINFGASVYTIQKYTPDLYEIGAKFLEGIGYKGFAEIEFKKDEQTGEFYLIEINARITNFNHLLYKVGLNFPYITYREMIGDPLEPKALTETTNRAFWYGYEDMLAVKDYIKSGQLKPSAVVKSLFRPKAYAIWSLQDPKPALSFMKTRVGKLFGGRRKARR